jgi:phage baseplate assembly protein W
MAAIKRSQAVTQTARIETVYSDFTTSFDIHPSKLDVMVDTNEEAVKRSIRNLLLTDRGERLFNPTLGSDIRSLLFENFSPQTESTLRDYIETTINNYEPRANLVDVVITPFIEANAYSVTIVFSVINKSEPIVLDILLNRIR